MSAKQDHYEDRLNPTAAEFILLILDELYDIARWVCSFSLTRTIARILGRHWDPDGSRLPEWKVSETPFKIVANEYIRLEGDQFAIYDGVVYNNAKIVGASPDEDTQLTAAEIACLQNYQPPLRNLTLARKIKRLLSEAKSDYEIALLAPCSESYVQHHRLALKKANTTNPS